MESGHPPIPFDPQGLVALEFLYASLGFLRPGPELSFGSSPRAVGAPGAGGSFAFADPDARLGYAYVMNKLDFYLEDDPRDLATPLSCSSNGLIGYLWFRLAACDP